MAPRQIQRHLLFMPLDIYFSTEFEIIGGIVNDKAKRMIKLSKDVVDNSY